MNAHSVGRHEPAIGRRLKIGAGLFGLSILLPVVGVPVVTALDLSGKMTASLSGALLFVAEGLGLVAVAVMGKSGYAYVKTRLFGFLKRHGPPDKVSRFRYTTGLVMFSVPPLFGWLSIYITGWIPGFSQNPVPYALCGDLLLVASLFVLGGNFWDKLRALFVHDAEVRFVSASPNDP